MAKLTKARIKSHDEASALLSLSRKLNDDEVWFVLENWEPSATNIVQKGAAFFTPMEIAVMVAQSANASTPEHYVDLCAGIGMLSWALLQVSRWSGDHHVTAVEFNREYVEIGKKLMPEVEWIHGDVFDQSLGLGTAERFHCAISNPPFGKVRTVYDTNWLQYRDNSHVHLMVVEVALRCTKQGAIVILPSSDLAWKGAGAQQHPSTSRAYDKWCRVWPDVHLAPCSFSTEGVKWRDANPAAELVNVDPCDLKELPPWEAR